jgi:poly-gamma-glutamate capsule biosynthesis protein CapA/YwtB (metallophosphatase superfamily)
MHFVTQHKRILLYLPLFVLVVLSVIFWPKPEQPLAINTLESEAVAATPKQDTLRFTISSVGDIMAHQTQLTAQKQADGTYSFTNNFYPMKALLSYADISIGNLETTFAGEKKGYSAYPRFNTPDALADAIKYSGINLVVTTNNHAYDYGGAALIRTLEILEDRKLEYVGTRKKSTDKNYVVRKVNGIYVGITAYTYESGKKDSLKTINGLVVSKEYQDLLNSYDPINPKPDLEDMQEVINNMRKDSAEFIVFVMHWGDEYKKYPNSSQVFMANQLNAMGVDLIFGSHPHVVQPVDFITHDSTGHQTFVAYSMGNFISNQRYESMQNYATEDGLFIGAEIIKAPNQKPKIHHVFYEPTWVNRYQESGKYFFEVIPANAYLAEKDSFPLKDEQWKRMENSTKRTTDLVETPMNAAHINYFEKYLRTFTPKMVEEKKD